jgi:hypothetical protein
MAPDQHDVPHLALRFLRWFCRPEMEKYIEGDLRELSDKAKHHV